MVNLDYYLPDVNIDILESIEVQVPNGTIEVMIGAAGYDNSHKIGTEYMHKLGKLVSIPNLGSGNAPRVFWVTIKNSYEHAYRACFIYHKGSIYTKFYDLDNVHHGATLNYNDDGFHLFLSGIEIMILKRELVTSVAKEKLRFGE